MTMQPNDREDALRLAREALRKERIYVSGYIHFDIDELERFYQLCRAKFAWKGDGAGSPLGWHLRCPKCGEEREGRFLYAKTAPTEGATPETDAAAMQFRVSVGETSVPIKFNREWCHSDFTRTLERQRNELRERVKEFEKDAARHRKMMDALTCSPLGDEDEDNPDHTVWRLEVLLENNADSFSVGLDAAIAKEGTKP